MTSASSIAFPTMEVPALDDTMEMASPYQGHADDFDIDLDVMEDQVSNPDRDMMGADDYPENTLETEYDADMIDDVAEPTMVDADDQYPDTSNSVEMHYSEKIYEAEMAEDDFDEDIDAHVSDFQEEANLEVPAEPVNDQEVSKVQHTEEVQELPVTKEETVHVEETNVVPDESNSNLQEHQVEASTENNVAPDHDQQEYIQPQQEKHEENVEQEHEADQPEGILDTEKNLPDTNETAQVEPQEIDPATRDGDDTTPKQPQEEPAHDDTQPSVDQHQDAEEKVEHKETLDTNEEVGHETGTDEHASALYPVKVYYQDNEISLFPPREGDSSETFFLEDENLAYEPFGKLLASCREVLCEHIADTEVLVVDIESLNLQLMEDSSHVSTVTLYQLVDLYLRLCHNDGADEPEALYLTLSTKLTIAAEVSDLFAAAEEGKGLSEIVSWDGYQEAGEFSPDNREENNQEQTQQDALEAPVEPQNVREPETHAVPDENPSAPAPDAAQIENDEQQEKGEPDSAPDNNGPEIAFTGNDAGPNSAEGNDDHESTPHEGDNVETHDHGSPDEGAYDSEEQKTDSTATLAPLQGVDSVNEQQYADQSTNASHDEHTARDVQYVQDGPEDDIPEGDAFSEDHSQDRTEQESAQTAGPGETKGNTVSSAPDDDDAAKRDVEGSHEDQPEENSESLHSEDEVVALTTNDPGNETEATVQADEGGLAPEGAESSLDNTISEQPEGQTQPSAGAPDDPEGFLEEVLNSTANYSDSGEDFEKNNLPEENQNEEVPLKDPSKDDAVELTFDDEHEEDDDYLDLGLGDEFNFDEEEPVPDSTGHASTKRQREPEDEVELAESPSPDAKRSRSS